MQKIQLGQQTLYNANCFDIFPLIPDNSIDMYLGDLPFGTTNCKWDSILPLDLIWKELNRIMKHNGIVSMFAQTPFDKVLGCSNLKDLRYEWIWEKTQATGFFNAKKMPMKAHENILFFSSEDNFELHENILIFYKALPHYFPQKTFGHNPMNSYTKLIEVQNRTEVYGKSTQNISGGGDTDRYPRSVLKFSSDKQINKGNGTIHPTQKPLELIKYLISTYTNEGNTVADFTAGSFTVALACEQLDRKSVCVDNETKYYEIGIKRMENYLNNKNRNK